MEGHLEGKMFAQKNSDPSAIQSESSIYSAPLTA